jgi:hypothetical protein
VDQVQGCPDRVPSGIVHVGELLAYDRNERRIAYPVLPTRDLDAVLDQLDRDPICIFGR